jgi:hypothetical protein
VEVKVDLATEAAFERKAEKHFRGHRGLLNGRDFRWNTERFRTDVGNATFERNYDRTFPGSPGSPEWWKKRFQ